MPSSKALHKLTKVHGNEGSHTDLKKLPRNLSASSLKKNSLGSNLKRNRSAADISKKPKAAQGNAKRPASVHFEIGDQDDWEEASSSASPALSRSASRSGQSSAKPLSANNSEPHSPNLSPTRTMTSATSGSIDRANTRQIADAKVITERLLQRTPSHNTTKMSLATATPINSIHFSESLPKSPGSGLTNSTPKTGSNDVVSRFVGGSGTPSDNSPFLQHRTPQPKHATEEVKRAKSMGNLTRQDSDLDEGSESALAPRSRKSSTGNAYIPPQQSRTQQKLWLQRAESNIEPQQINPGVAINGGLAGFGTLGGSALIGAGYEGRDPRIKVQLERTGLEYLVVRRYQDPVGASLKRLSRLPGAEKNRIIPYQNLRKADSGVRFGLSQSLRESRKPPSQKSVALNGARSSFEGAENHEVNQGDRRSDDGSAGVILRSMWDKIYDIAGSAECD